MKIKLGTKLILKGHGRKRRLVQKEEQLVYVPLLDTLQMLLKNDEILGEVRLSS